MEAKDTVMKEDGKRPCVFTGKGKYRTPWSIADKTAKAQAEISFNARQDEIDLLLPIISSEDVAITDLKSLLELAKEYAGKERQAGIKEVVDWVKANALYIHPENKVWQAKLKDWGFDVNE